MLVFVSVESITLGRKEEGIFLPLQSKSQQVVWARVRQIDADLNTSINIILSLAEDKKLNIHQNISGGF